MKSISYGKDYVYADTRLRGTVILTKKNEPIQINFMDHGNGAINGIDLLSHKEYNGSINDLNLVPPKVGYYIDPHKSHTVFTQRVPSRYYKHGLSSKNVRAMLPLKGGWGFVNIAQSGIAEMLVNKYPKHIDSLERLIVGESLSRPLNRNWAMLVGDNIKNIKLLFKNNVVGKVKWNDHGDINYQLSPDYDFLETLMEKELYA